VRNYITYEWFTIFTLIGLLAIVGAKYINSLRFNDFLYVISNSKYLKIYTKDQKFIDLFDSFLFTNLSISLSIFSYFVYTEFVSPADFELITFLKLLFSVASILIIKTLLERLVGSLFEIDRLIDNYLFQKTTFKNYLGLLFLAANVLLLYTNLPVGIVIVSTISVIGLINLIGFLTSFKNHQKLLNPNFFYFLLYLCALEIAPYVLLYKVFREYNT